MIYTRKGDRGTSGLFGTKERFPKDGLLFEALGAVDELNSLLGLCRMKAELHGDRGTSGALLQIQECLFIVQAELAGADKSLSEAYLNALEEEIGCLEKSIRHPRGFIISGATELSALLDFARAVSRRTERAVISAKRIRQLSQWSLAYLNRLSSFLYAQARYAAEKEGIRELSPSYYAYE